jgi:hypothetical protein
MPHFRAIFNVPLGALSGQCAHAGDVAGALGDTDGSPRIEQIERMG